MKELNPQDTPRAFAYSLWKNAPMPMLTVTKTLDVTNVVKVSKKRNLKLNMLMMWCIGKVATSKKEFFLIPKGDKMLQYDCFAVEFVVKTPKHESPVGCMVPYYADIEQFNQCYLQKTKEASETGENLLLENYAKVTTSSVVKYELDSVTPLYDNTFLSSPLLVWGKYRKGFFKYSLPISFQFHHIQMDLGDACEFLDGLQKTFNSLGKEIKI